MPFGQITCRVKPSFPLAFAAGKAEQRPCRYKMLARGARLSGTIQCGLRVASDLTVGDSAGE